MLSKSGCCAEIINSQKYGANSRYGAEKKKKKKHAVGRLRRHRQLGLLQDQLAAEVILGDDPALPPVFAHHGGLLRSAKNLVAAIGEAKRNGASGVVLNVTTTREGVAVLFCDSTFERTWYGNHENTVHLHTAHLGDVDAASPQPTLPRVDGRGELAPTLQESVKECLRLGLRLIVHADDFDPRVLVAVHEVFTERPELYRRAVVSSASQWFLYFLRKRNPRIVTALSWRPYSIAYKDTECTHARFQSLPVHWLAKTVDWILEMTIPGGLVLHVTGVSALMMRRDTLSADSVRTWRAQGLHVIAWAPNHTVGTDFLRKVLKVPVVVDVVRQA
ncbi:glycerophosphodiester phosphodiesterase 1-like [Amblyomma americanum]